MIKDLVAATRSYRGFDHSYKIDRQTLEDLVDSTRLACSTVNAQPIKYFLAYEEETVNAIQKNTMWAKKLAKIMTLPHPGKEPTAFIVICQDDQIDQNLNRFQRDIGIYAWTMLLAATEKGLGGCMIGSFSPAGISEIMGLPENIHPLLVVAVGKPDEKVVITDVTEERGTGYYRDENDVHYVPKRKLEDLLLN